MDELKLKLSTRFMRGIFAKFIGKAIKKQLGCDMNVLINEMVVTHEDGMTRIQMNVEGEIENSELMKLLKRIGMD